MDGQYPLISDEAIAEAAASVIAWYRDHPDATFSHLEIEVRLAMRMVAISQRRSDQTWIQVLARPL